MSSTNLPSHWCTAPIGELCSLFNGRAFKQSEWSASGLPIIRIQNLNSSHAAFNYFKGTLEDKHLVKKGDLLFAWSGTPGTSFGTHEWLGEDAALNQHIFKITFSGDKISKSFLKYAIDQKLDELISCANGGVGLRHITKSNFENTKISLPPFAEQEIIAEKIDIFLAQVENTKARIERIHQTLVFFRQSLLAAAVSGRLTEEWREEHFLQFSWQTKTLNEISSDISYGYTASSSSAPVGPKMLRITDIQDNKVKWDSVPYCEIEEKKKENYLLKKGDLLFARTGATVGKSFLIKDHPPEAVYASYLIRVRCHDENFIKYLALFFQSDAYWNQIVEFSSGVGQPSVNGTKLKELVIPVPPFKEQVEIVRRVEELFGYADNIEKQIQGALAHISNLAQAILAKAFCGDLSEQWCKENWDLVSGENSALALLEKIKIEREILAKELKTKKETVGVKLGNPMSKEIKVFDALKAVGEPLNGKQLLVAAGYPNDSNVEQMERFFLDVRRALMVDKTIIKVKRSGDGQDWFALAKTK